MHVDLGPILYIDECTPEAWCFRVHLLVRGASDVPPIQVSVREKTRANVQGPTLAHAFPEYDPADDYERGAYYWSWRVEAQRDDEKQWLTYLIGTDEGDEVPGVHGSTFPDVCIPAQGTLPNIAFFSCNGESHETSYHGPQHAQRMWQHIRDTHENESFGSDKGAYSLLIGGGDQIYADKLWQREPLKRYKDLPFEKVVKKDTPDDFKKEVQNLYVSLYTDHWGKHFMRKVFARVPGAFTWDDHDIRDGWGSHPGALQESSCYETVERVASDCFEAFQLGGRQLTTGGGNGERGGPQCRTDAHYLQSLSFRAENAHLDVALLDIRSDRTRDQVLSDAQWGDLKDFFRDHQESTTGESDADPPARHLLLVSSIPLVHYRYYMEKVPLNAKGLNDDLIDQWEHDNHRGERARLIRQLLRQAKQANCRVTILSGDVHVGARGRITSSNPRHLPDDADGSAANSRAIIHQLTSSAIGHSPPTSLMWAGIDAITEGDPEPVGDQVTAEMLRISPAQKVVRARNWLSVRFDDPREHDEDGVRLWGKWFYEHEDDDMRNADVRGVGEEAVIPAY